MRRQSAKRISLREATVVDTGPVHIMDYPRILSQVYGVPWHVTTETHEVIRRTLELRLAGSSSPEQAVRYQSSFSDSYQVFAPMAPSGVEVVSMSGIIGRHLSSFAMSCGGLDSMQVELRLRNAAANPSVRGIFLWVDSPGGSAMSISEIANLVQTISSVKPVMAFTDSIAASAAYWIASHATNFFATPTSLVGSVGTILAWVDKTKRMEMEGDRAVIFQGGRLKSAGYSGKEMSAEESAYFQGLVDVANRSFTGAVKLVRGVDDDHMQGQAFIASTAVDTGMIDATVPSAFEAMDHLVNLIQNR